MKGRRFALDVVILAWAVAWVVVGVLVAREVQGLAQISDTVRASGVAIQRAGDALAGLDGLPIVGADLQAPAEAAREAGRSAVESAAVSKENARQVGVLLGVSIALIPSLPLLILYVPQRIVQERERRVVSRLLRSGRTQELDELLAIRAAARLPADRVVALGGLARKDRLAEAELERLDLPRSPG